MIDLFVPGRLCLFGEHSDWAGALRRTDTGIERGACIITGTEQGIFARAEAAPAFEMTSRLPGGELRGPFRVAMNGPDLDREATSRDFFSYAAGVAAQVWKDHRPPGVRIHIDEMNLPVARGLSSSAAVCVLTARAFNRVHRLGLNVRGEMDLAYRGELAAGSRCGRMDQACAYGQQLSLLGFDGDHMSVEPIASAGTFHLLIVDLCRKKDTRRILGDLHEHFRNASSPHHAALRDALGPANRRLIDSARSVLAGDDARALGELMTAAQERFDRCVAPACRSELAAPALHALLDDAEVRALSWGAKGVGSQGDGAAQLVCRGPDERRVLARMLSRRRLACLSLTLAPTG